MTAISERWRLRAPGGFSLLEMLVVISIIGILVAVGLRSLESNDGVPLGVAAEQFESVARTARERALASGKPVLLAFLLDSSNERGDRRSLHVHVEEEDGWQMVDDPEYFPEGIYLDTEKSTGLLTGTFQPQKDEGEVSFSGIVFRPDQYCEQAGARVVFMSGSREESGAIEAKRSALSAGFLVSRTGHVTRSDLEEPGS